MNNKYKGEGSLDVPSRPSVIRPLLFFFMGFFLGNGAIIKGEFTQNFYELSDVLTQKVFSSGG
jgi:hypothetical protein